MKCEECEERERMPVNKGLEQVGNKERDEKRIRLKRLRIRAERKGGRLTEKNKNGEKRIRAKRGG